MRAVCQFDGCRAEFEAERKSARYCSERCKKAAQRKATKPRRTAPTNPARFPERKRAEAQPPSVPLVPPVQHHEPDPPQPRPVVMAERESAPNLLASRVAGVLARLPGARNHDQTKPQFRKGTML